MDINKVILFSDMDGTLLDSRKRISPENMEAIDRFRAMGGRFTIATGRTIQSFEQYTKLLKLREPVIMYNGAAIHDYVNGKTLYSCPLPEKSREMAMELMRLMPTTGGEVLTAEGTYVFSNTEYQQLHTKLCGITPEYRELPDIPAGNWLKVLFSLAPEDVPQLEILAKQLGFDKKADFVRSSEIFLEMLPKGVSKGSALNEYRRLPGMEDMFFVSVGDFDNDIEMIEAADLGACPANAEGSVQERSKLVLSSTNDESALAELVEYIIENADTF